MMPAVDAAGFQYKNGAAFIRGDEYGEFDFGDKFTPGRDSTFQVQRATFDKLLADEAQKQGVEIRYEVRVDRGRHAAAPRRACARSDAAGREYDVEARFILDASGFGRTLPKLLRSGDAVGVSRCAMPCSRTSRITRRTARSIATRSRSSCIRSIATCGTG